MERTDPKQWLGVVLPGGYEIAEHIRSGGMGAVFRAVKHDLERTVAVKVIHRDLLSDTTAVRRFIKEARMMSMLNHPNALSVVDYGNTREGVPYMITEFLRGQDLRTLFESAGPMPFDRVAGVLLQVLDALAEAHRLGIVHRDVKPDNIVIDPLRSGTDFAKLIDFGIATLMSPQAGFEPVTALGTFVGTPEFLAPEQIRGEPIDGRVDVYGVGVTLFLLLSGQFPFSGKSNVAVLTKKLRDDPPDPREIAPERAIPNSLATAAVRALQRDPDQRFPDARTFIAALREAQREARVSPQARRRPQSKVLWCRHCGEGNAADDRFCGACGTPLQTDAANFSRPTPATNLAPTRRGEFYAQDGQTTVPFLDRSEDLKALTNVLLGRTDGLHALRLEGPVGVGKTALARVLSDLMKRRGHTTVWVEPDPWHAGVSLHGLRSALRQLTQLPLGEDADPRELPGVTREAVLGYPAIFRGSDDDPVSGDAWIRHGIELLRWALRRAASHGNDQPALVVLDDFEAFDTASAEVFVRALAAIEDVPGWLVATQERRTEPDWPQEVPIHELGPLGSDAAVTFVGGSVASRWLAHSATDQRRPLHVEHLHRFVRECKDDPPSLLSDLIAARFARLGSKTQRLLQALAVLGREAALADATEISEISLDPEREAALLESGGWVWYDGLVCGFAHPIVREIVIDSIPAEASRKLHGFALTLFARRALPKEARAHYMSGAGHVFGALTLWDQIGSEALRRADPLAAMHAFHRALTIARGEEARGEMLDPAVAIAGFSRKLAVTLLDLGRPSEAYGLLMPCVSMPDLTPAERSKLFHSASRAARARGLHDEADQWLDRAVSLAGNAKDPEWIELLGQERGGLSFR